MIKKKSHDTFLLTFAHRGEARAFLSEFKGQLIGDNLYLLKSPYENSNIFLLLTGEGLEKSFCSLSLTLGKYQREISQVINYGVCGLLREKSTLKMGDLIKIRTVYAQEQAFQNHMKFKSFPLFQEGEEVKNHLSSPPTHDVVTASARVLSSELRDYLDNFAPLVDRELWAQAYACQFAQIDIQSYKLISDYARAEICAQVKEKAPLWSDRFLRHFISLMEDPTPPAPFLPDEIKLFFCPEEREKFHITLSHERTLRHLLRAISIKGLDFTEVKKDISLNEILQEEIRPKERTKRLIESLTAILNPLETALKRKLKVLTYSLEKAGFKIKHDRELDNERLHLSCTLSKEEDFQRFSQSLKSFDFQRWESTLKGKDI